MQVVNLQAQLASLKEQAAQSILNASAAANPSDDHQKIYYGSYEKLPFDDHHEELDHFQNLFLQGNSSMTTPQLINQNISSNSTVSQYYDSLSGSTFFNPNSNMGNYRSSSVITGEDVSFSSFGESCFDMQQANSSRQWSFQDTDDLQSVAFGYGTTTKNSSA